MPTWREVEGGVLRGAQPVAHIFCVGHGVRQTHHADGSLRLHERRQMDAQVCKRLSQKVGVACAGQLASGAQEHLRQARLGGRDAGNEAS